MSNKTYTVELTYVEIICLRACAVYTTDKQKSARNDPSLRIAYDKLSNAYSGLSAEQIIKASIKRLSSLNDNFTLSELMTMRAAIKVTLKAREWAKHDPHMRPAYDKLVAMSKEITKNMTEKELIDTASRHMGGNNHE